MKSNLLAVTPVESQVGLAAAGLVDHDAGLRADDPYRCGGLLDLGPHEDRALRAVGLGVVEGGGEHALQPVGLLALADVVVAGHRSAPPGPEPLAEESAAVEGLVVEVGVGAERDHRLEVRRLQARDGVLGDREVRHPPQADVAVGPGLRAGPLDRVVVVLGLLDAERRLQARAVADAAGVDADADVALRDPDRGVDALVVLVLQAVGVAGEVAVLLLLLVRRFGLARR